MSRYEMLWCDWCNSDQDREPTGEDDAHEQGWVEWWGRERRESCVEGGSHYNASVTIDLCATCKDDSEAVAWVKGRGFRRAR